MSRKIYLVIYKDKWGVQREVKLKAHVFRKWQQRKGIYILSAKKIVDTTDKDENKKT